MIRRILKAFGFIHKTEICKAALDIYLKYDLLGEKIEENYYNIGATGAMWEICRKLGIDLYSAVRRAHTEMFKKMYGGK